MIFSWKLPVYYFIYIFLSVSLSPAQEYLEIYKGYLPQDVLKSPELSAQAAENLANYSSIHPELIYFYITDLQLWFTAKDTGSARLMDKYLTQLKNSYLELRRNWADNQVEQLLSKKTDADLITTGKSSMNDFSQQSISLYDAGSPPVPVETEKMDNIVRLYYQTLTLNTPRLIMDGEMGRVEFEQNIVEQFERLARGIEAVTDDQVYSPSIIDEYKTFWYLFPIVPNPMIESFSIFSDLLNHVYSNISSFSNFSISYMKVYNHSYYFKHRLQILPDNYSCDISAEHPIDERLATISISYSYRFKPINVSFSKMTVSLSYTQNNVEQKKTMAELQATAKPLLGGFDKIDFSIHSLRSVFLDVTTPLIYLNNNIAFESGGLFVLNEIRYSINYDYIHSQISFIHLRASANNQTKKQIIFTPIIKMTANIPYSLSLTAFYSFWVHSAGITYNF